MCDENRKLVSAEKTEQNIEIAIIDERTIRNKIYEVRGVKVMLDFEIAEIYGYTTSRFNEQVSNNIEKFKGDDFCFYLTQEEFSELKNMISKKSTSSWGGRRKPPRAFTESGLYMLMTVLRGELATMQSRALIRIFRTMKDYIVDTQGLAMQRDLLRLSIQTTENTEAIKNVQSILTEQQKLLIEHDDRLMGAFEQISGTVKKSEISPFLLDFSKPKDQREYLFLNGQPVKADITYMEIYSQAKHSICIVDDYINLKTLHLLQDVSQEIAVTIFSDNNYNKLRADDYADFQRESPDITIDFIRTMKTFHDRFIVLDYNTKNERVFHCGGSSKDGGNKVMVITELEEGFVRNGIHEEITKMLTNPKLVLN